MTGAVILDTRMSFEILGWRGLCCVVAVGVKVGS